MHNTEKSKLAISYSGLSDKGYIREENQDSYGKFPEGRIDVYQPKGILFVIADGMGGHENGKVASSTAVDVTREKYFSDIIVIPGSSPKSMFSFAFALAFLNLMVHTWR